MYLETLFKDALLYYITYEDIHFFKLIQLCSYDTVNDYPVDSYHCF